MNLDADQADININVTMPSAEISLSAIEVGGIKGDKGEPGQGVPAGGSPGQVLAKLDDQDYNTIWVEQSGGGGAGGAVSSVNGQTGTVVLGKSDVGLGSVDNTSDANKPLSTAVSAALSNKVDKVAGKELSTNDYTSAEKTKLSGIAANATQNSSDASLRDRSTHTGSQPVSTITGLQTALDGKQAAGDYATNTALTTGLVAKANISHTHNQDDITGLTTVLNSKADASSVPAQFNPIAGANVLLSGSYPNITIATSGSDGAVDSINGNTGIVVLDQDDIGDGATAKQFTATEKTKLSGISTGATANDTDANLKNRANHTGTQAQSTITNLTTDLAAKAPLASPAFTGTPTGITKAHVGLGNVDNTADAEKPVSTATQTALNGKSNSSHTHAGSDITGTGKSATTFLRGDNTWVVPTNTTYTPASQAEIENASSTTARLITGQRMAQGAIAATASAIASKADSSELSAHIGNASNPHSVTKAQVGLGSVDNTSDLAKPLSTAQSVALGLKVEKDSLVYNVKDHGVVGDGVADEAAALNALFSGGNKHIYFPAGSYRIETYIRVYANTVIDMHPNATILNDSRDTESAFLNGEEGNPNYASGYGGEGNIIFRGGTIDMILKSNRSEYTQAIAIGHAQNITIENVTFRNNRLSHFIEINASKAVIIRGCNFYDHIPVVVGNREAINIDHSTQAGFPQFGSWDDTVCDDILIEGCRFINGDVSAGSHTAPPSGYNHKNVRFLNNYVDGMESAGVGSKYWVESRVEGNTFMNIASNVNVQYTSNIPLKVEGSYLIDIPDDSAASVALTSPNRQTLALINCSSTAAFAPRGVIWVRCNPGELSSAAISVASASSVTYTSGALTGTTGTDGRTTIAADVGKVWIENRTGGGRLYQIQFLSQ